MPKITFNDLPAAVEALLLRMDILHDLVKSTRDTLDKLVQESDGSPGAKKVRKPARNHEKSVSPGDELLDIGKAAAFLGITNSSLYMAVERRQVAHFRKLNRLFFKKSDLEIYKQSLSEKTPGYNPAKPIQDEPTMTLGEDDDKLLTMEEAVEHTGITRSNLYAYVKTRKVPYIKKGRRLYFPEVALNQLMIMSITKPSGRNRRKKGAGESGEPLIASSDPDRVTLREVVKMIGKRPSTVYYQLRKMNIPVVAKQGNVLYYSLKAVKQAFPEND